MSNRILIIVTTKLSLNGISKSVMNYYEYLDKSKYQIDFVVQNSADDFMKQKILDHNGRLFILQNRSRKLLSYSKKLTEIIRNGNYQVVHIHGSSRLISLELFIAKREGIPIRIPHSHSSSNKYKLMHKMLKGPFDKLYTYPVACGKAAANWFYGNENAEILNNGIDLNDYKLDINIREQMREKYNINKKELLITHVGHFIYPKNHEFLIDIFKQLYDLNKDYKLMLIGDGPLFKPIQDKVRNLKLEDKVIFLGRINNVPDLLQASDLIIHPSIFEGVPLTLIEAQATNLPCYVSNNVSQEVGITKLVSFISLEMRAEEWACNIEEKMNAKTNRNANLLDNQRRIIDAGYDIEFNANKLMQIYDKLIKKEVK